MVEPLCEFHKDEVRAMGRDLGLPLALVHRHPFPGPGLAIRILCQAEACIREDFSATNSLLATLASFNVSVQQPSAVLQTILQQCSAHEQEFLLAATAERHLSATLLPIYSVGVQGDCRTYNYVAALSSNSEPDWKEVMELAKIIPRICHNVNRWGCRLTLAPVFSLSLGCALLFTMCVAPGRPRMHTLSFKCCARSCAYTDCLPPSGWCGCLVGWWQDRLKRSHPPTSRPASWPPSDKQTPSHTTS